MKRNFDLIIVMPIGPNCNLHYIDDTIESIKYYFFSKYKLLILDDSHKGAGAEIQLLHPDAEILKTIKNLGVNAGLYINLCQAYQHALENYYFELL